MCAVSQELADWFAFGQDKMEISRYVNKREYLSLWTGTGGRSAAGVSQQYSNRVAGSAILHAWFEMTASVMTMTMMMMRVILSWCPKLKLILDDISDFGR